MPSYSIVLLLRIQVFFFFFFWGGGAGKAQGSQDFWLGGWRLRVYGFKV